MLLVKDLFSFVIWLFYMGKYYRTSVLVRVLKLFYTKKNSKNPRVPSLSEMIIIPLSLKNLSDLDPVHLLEPVDFSDSRNPLGSVQNQNSPNC